MVRDRDRTAFGAFGIGDPVSRLFIGYVDFVMRDPPTDEATALMVGRHITDLFLAATQTVRDGAEVELRRGRRAARLRLAMDYVLRHLGDADLTAARVGRHLAISTRAMQMHFEAAGMTFSGFLLEQRLLRVLRDLRDPRCDAKTVAELAFAAGFHDISHFNRCFRRRFGDTPSSVRSAAS